ncbi:MAG: BlaI/MecI/CopY family transcriptional regulator [Acidimicrobiales bacterium]
MGPLEAEVLACVREKGSASVADVVEVVNQARPDRPLAYRTVLAVLSHLEAKALLSHNKQGRAYHYQATMSDEEFVARKAAEASAALIRRFGGAAVAGFVSQVSSEPRLREMLERLLAEDGD